MLQETGGAPPPHLQLSSESLPPWLCKPVNDTEEDQEKEEEPAAGSRQRVTSMYLLPMWCLCLCSARSLCSSLTNRTRASPFLLPWALRQSATPPL